MPSGRDGILQREGGVTVSQPIPSCQATTDTRPDSTRNLLDGSLTLQSGGVQYCGTCPQLWNAAVRSGLQVVDGAPGVMPTGLRDVAHGATTDNNAPGLSPSKALFIRRLYISVELEGYIPQARRAVYHEGWNPRHRTVDCRAAGRPCRSRRKLPLLLERIFPDLSYV
ncbi:hypothetical protein LIA77_08209 [Sarocladium implicatum]|nr:hypothetical protein LIA77_08209 [Sarocladium implicatum]